MEGRPAEIVCCDSDGKDRVFTVSKTTLERVPFLLQRLATAQVNPVSRQLRLDSPYCDIMETFLSYTSSMPPNVAFPVFGEIPTANLLEAGVSSILEDPNVNIYGICEMVTQDCGTLSGLTEAQAIDLFCLGNEMDCWAVCCACIKYLYDRASEDPGAFCIKKIVSLLSSDIEEVAQRVIGAVVSDSILGMQYGVTANEMAMFEDYGEFKDTLSKRAAVFVGKNIKGMEAFLSTNPLAAIQMDKKCMTRGIDAHLHYMTYVPSNPDLHSAMSCIDAALCA